MAMERTSLSQVLIQLRRDLLEAQKEGEGQDLRFVVEDAEVELQVVATSDTEGGIGVRFWVISAEGGAKAGDTLTQTLRLKLSSVDQHGNPVYVSGRDRR